jgi:phosphatidylserine decarboxylase
MLEILYVNRKTGQIEKEKVYGQFFLKLLYGNAWFCKCLSFLLLPAFTRVHFPSKIYGWLQKILLSKRKVLPFIKEFKINVNEFLDPPESFQSFNDFFIRKLKKECRPMADASVVMPADGRYRVYPMLDQIKTLSVKGKMLSLKELLQQESLAQKYEKGSLVMARLCPVDYHRFHFPCDCVPSTPKLVNGALFSVNPIAIKKNLSILSENKRMITSLGTKELGTILYIDVGATAVGSIHQTFTPEKLYQKGDEKGFFSFGGSLLLLLFEKGKIVFDQDLMQASEKGLEVLGQMGQSLGRAYD